MGKWKAIPPAPLASQRASWSDRRKMDAMTRKRNRCPRCKTVYRKYETSKKCEAWHGERQVKQQRIYDRLKHMARLGDERAARLVKNWKWEE